MVHSFMHALHFQLEASQFGGRIAMPIPYTSTSSTMLDRLISGTCIKTRVSLLQGASLNHTVQALALKLRVLLWLVPAHIHYTMRQTRRRLLNSLMLFAMVCLLGGHSANSPMETYGRSCSERSLREVSTRLRSLGRKGTRA